MTTPTDRPVIGRTTAESTPHWPAPPTAPAGAPIGHGATYSAHPVACAAALATLETIETTNLIDRAGEIERLMKDQLGRLQADDDRIGDVRGRGAMIAVELVKSGTAEPDPELTKKLCAAAHAAGELNIYNWGDYTSPEMIKKFEEKYDVKVTITDYDSNDTALAKVKAGAHGFDMVVPSAQFIPIWVADGLLLESRPDQMENFKNVDPRWIDVEFDPGRPFARVFAQPTANLRQQLAVAQKCKARWERPACRPAPPWPSRPAERQWRRHISCVSFLQSFPGVFLPLSPAPPLPRFRVQFPEAKLA